MEEGSIGCFILFSPLLLPLTNFYTFIKVSLYLGVYRVIPLALLTMTLLGNEGVIARRHQLTKQSPERTY